jgi:hypothetical protein
MGRFILLGSSILFIGLSDPSQLKYGWPALGLLLLAIDLIWSPVITVGMAIQVFGWIATEQWVMSAIMLSLAVFHWRSVRQHSLRIDPAGITLSFPWKRQVKWDAVSFIILKDGMLTIEYKNGSVLQQMTQKDPMLNEADFNEFCNQQCNA